MPYKLVKDGDGKYQVKNTETGKMHSKKPIPKKRAIRQFRLLEAIEHNPGWRPTHQ
jgi:hypothetical protein